MSRNSKPSAATVSDLLTAHMWDETWYIAIHRHGFGVDTDPAKAILLAQESVPLKAKPSPTAHLPARHRD
jgi:hypothetical protein